MSEKSGRPWFRLHFGTLIILSVLITGLLLLNGHERFHFRLSPEESVYGCGFPFIYWDSFILKGDRVQQYPMDMDTRVFIYNVMVWTGVAIVAAIVSESIIRRRGARTT